MIEAAMPNMEAGKSSMWVFRVLTSSVFMATRQFSSSLASISSMMPCSTRSLQESCPDATLSMCSTVSAGLPLSTRMSGLRTRPELRLMYSLGYAFSLTGST